MQEISKLYKGAKLLEAIDNYALADRLSPSQMGTDSTSSVTFYDDSHFWESIIKDTENFWGRPINLYQFVVSKWMARVPGLYWLQSSKTIRKHSQEDIAFQSNEWLEFYPPGKSKKVLGGIGTILLPPSSDGKCLISVSAGCNASVGIPVLLYPDVLEALKIQEGDAINITAAKWIPMDVQWASHFATTKEIPRGYLVVDNIKKIAVTDRDIPTIFHPFSIMEYASDDALMYDFVYITADTHVENVEGRIENFFKEYAKKEGRNGEYLISPNLVKPIFESRYSRPSDLVNATERAQIKLLQERIRASHFNGVPIQALIQAIPKYYETGVAIRRLAKAIGISSAQLAEDSAASMSAQLIVKCLEKEITEQLIDRLVFEYPFIFI